MVCFLAFERGAFTGEDAGERRRGGGGFAGCRGAGFGWRRESVCSSGSSGMGGGSGRLDGGRRMVGI